MNAVSMTNDLIASKIYFIRSEKVLLDSDLALLYGVETKVLNPDYALEPFYLI